MNCARFDCKGCMLLCKTEEFKAVQGVGVVYVYKCSVCSNRIDGYSSQDEIKEIHKNAIKIEALQ